MNPNQEEYSIDYLNQIAAPAKKPGLDKKFLILIGGGLLAAIVLLIVVIGLSGSGGASTPKLQTMSVRLETLSSVTDDAKKHVRSNSLRVANANLSNFLTNAITDLEAPLASVGVQTNKIDKAIQLKHDGTKLKQTLEDARLNITTYDRTYAREMSYELTTLHVLMQDIYKTTKSKSMKEVLVKADENLTSIRKQVEAFTDSTS